MRFGKLECRLASLCDPELQIPPAKSLGAIARIIELLRQTGVHVRDVEFFEVVVAVQRPVGADQIVLRRGEVARELVDRHERDSLAHGPDPIAERHLRSESAK